METSLLNIFDKNNYIPFSFSFYNIGYNIKYFFRNIKYAYQRITRGFCDRDIWNLDFFYTELFIKSLTEFTKDMHTVPNRFYIEDKDGNSWKKYIEEMVSHFAKSQDELLSHQEQVDEINKGLQMMGEVYFDLWD